MLTERETKLTGGTDLELSNSRRCCPAKFAFVGAEVAGGAFLELTKYIRCWTRSIVRVEDPCKKESSPMPLSTYTTPSAETWCAEELGPLEPSVELGEAREEEC